MQDNARRGITLMICAAITFAMLDGFSRYLAGNYNVIIVVMFRYWFFSAFVIALSSSRSGGVVKAAATARPVVQVLRGLLLPANICCVVLSFTFIGLVETHAILACYPLISAALSMPILGERVGWRRWTAICIGFCGVLIILRPGLGVFSPFSLVPLAGASMFALYGVLTRLVSRRDGAETSLFWTGTVGALAMTIVGPFFWNPMHGIDWLWMVVTGALGVGGHFMMIKALEAAEPATIQPFSYFQLVCVSIIGVAVFDETLDPMIVVGTVIIVGAALFAFWRERQLARSGAVR